MNILGNLVEAAVLIAPLCFLIWGWSKKSINAYSAIALISFILLLVNTVLTSTYNESLALLWVLNETFQLSLILGAAMLIFSIVGYFKARNNPAQSLLGKITLWYIWIVFLLLILLAFVSVPRG